MHTCCIWYGNEGMHCSSGDELGVQDEASKDRGRDPAVGPRVCSSLGAGSHLVCVAAILSVMWCMICMACGGECRKVVHLKHFSQC